MKAKLRLCYKAVLLILLFLAGFVIAGGLFPAIQAVCSPVRSKSVRDRIKLRWLKGFGAILNLHVIKDGGVSEKGLFLVCNHISWLDIIVLGHCIPGCFVAKSDIANWPVIGYLSKQAGTIFIRRGDKQQIHKTAEKMAWQFRQNGNVIAFPEGTTTSGDEVLDFHASLFQPALLTKSAIQPAVIQYVAAAREAAPFIGDDEFLPHLLRILALDKIEVRLSLLPVIDGLGKNRNAVCVEARNRIAEAISMDRPELDGSAICQTVIHTSQR